MLIQIEKLKDNQLNPNVMPDEVFEKLKENIRKQDGKYPPIIVRPIGDEYRIVDGHNRKKALGELDYKEVNCEVWDIDDKTEMLLLATLNELKGTQDLTKRANLLQTITDLGIERNNLIKLIPEDNRRLDFILSIAGSKEDIENITDDVSRKNAEIELEREALREKFIKDGIDPKRAEAMADIYSFKDYVPKPDTDIEGKKVGLRPFLMFWFKDEEEYKKVCAYFDTDGQKEPNSQKLLELIK